MWTTASLSTRMKWAVLTEVAAMDLMMEETFGPIIGIMKVESDEEALGLMNDSPYGLVRASIPSFTSI